MVLFTTQFAGSGFRARGKWLWVLVLALLAGCSAPRSITHSGMVTPKGHVKAGGNMVGTLSSETISRLAIISRDAVRQLSNQDSAFLGNQIDNISAALVSYALDPSGVSFDLYARYGLAKRLEVGYKYGFGAHAFDAMYQFMGPPGSSQAPEPGQWYGSAGLQYSWQKFGLPKKLLLDRLQPILDFGAVRRDVLLPVVFSYSFGPEEKYGHIGFGAVYQRSFIRYNFEPGRLYEYLPGSVDEQVQVKPFSHKSGFGAGGIFANGKVGYRHVYLLPAITMYYQNYGRFELPGNRSVNLKGVTIIPSLGLQVWFGKGR